MFEVSAFVEKPDAKTAEGYVEAGYLWNAGMFVMQCGAFSRILSDLHPAMAQTFQALANGWDDAAFRAAELVPLWESLPKIAIDHAIAEPAAALGLVAVAPMAEDARWSDLGDFVALDRAGAERLSLQDDKTTVLIDAKNSIVRAGEGKAVVVVGIADAVVIDTPDALLVTTRANAQRVKEAPAALSAQGLSSLI